jgi:hypothetical protein
MSDLFGRRYLLTIGDLDVSALDLTFNVAKSTTREPNTCEVRVYNLSRDHRAQLARADAPRVVLRAGYEADGDPPPLLFLGSARRVFAEREETDIVLTVQASDSGRELLTGRISRSYAPGTRATAALADAIDAAGIGRGNFSDFEAAYVARNGSAVFADGFVADGPARRVIQALARAARLRWSVQNGALQLMRTGQALQAQAPQLSAASGLVGTPTRDEHGKVSATVLLQPGLDPGRRVVLVSSEIEGGYEIRQVVYKGATAGGEWYATLDLAPLT